jgi:hypothetical protein
MELREDLYSYAGVLESFERAGRLFPMAAH